MLEGQLVERGQGAHFQLHLFNGGVKQGACHRWPITTVQEKMEGCNTLFPEDGRECQTVKGAGSMPEGKGEGVDHAKFWEKAAIELPGDLQALEF